MSSAELWALIDQSNSDTRRMILENLAEVRERLDSYLTRDQFAAEKALLELRLNRAEAELRELDAKHAALEDRLRTEREEAQRRRADELEAERRRSTSDQEAQRRAEAARRASLQSNLLFKVAVPVLLVLLPLLMALWSPLR